MSTAATEPATEPVTAPGPFDPLDSFLRRARYAQDQLIEALHVAQDLYGHLSDEVLIHLARELRIPASRVYGVATFYHLFSFDPPGAHTCTVCTGTACFVKGADDIVQAVQTTYGVAPGGTTADGDLGLNTARCLGSCGLAPVMVLDGEVRGHQNVEDALGLIADAVETPAVEEVP
ncbi:NAD(P)H-dependent oxidoreductase subunit E [Euzebya sp.]|uniref:NAD(P)H-dependent oxidoreductase subunit E n=1 Tax=Euzebya sp. TaxID=1971409 RepID=UPI003512ED22